MITSFSPFFLRFLRLFAAILILLAPTRSYAISVDRSEQEMRSMPLASATPNGARLPTAQVNQQLDHVLNAPEYAWRNPSKAEAPPGWLEQFRDWLRDVLGSFGRTLGRLGRTLSRWLASLYPHVSGIPTGGTDGMSTVAQILSWVTIVGAVTVLTLILIKIISRRRTIAPPAIHAAAPAPDLESEDTTADQLPDDEWLRLARQKVEEGDLRQALRALFLAALSLLGAQGLVRIRKSKSNFDYERELRRKLNAVPGLDAIFSADRKLFERCWYGAHPVSVAEFDQSESLYQRLKHACLAKNGGD
ncbi:MAG: hypothetical protein JO025_26100 [Verrucomicrobia bacterium]|nr:hypothetical protein [Verrucomicrobiota bacterium]